MLGRKGRASPINTMRKLTQQAGASARWTFLGWMGVLAGVLILSYFLSFWYVLMGSLNSVPCANEIYTSQTASMHHFMMA